MAWLDIITNNSIIIVALWWTAIIGYVIWHEFYRNRGKIQCRIKTPLEETERWIKPEREGGEDRLVFEKPKDKKKPGWIATYTNKSLISRSSWFGLRRWFAIDIFPQAEKAVEWDHALKKEEQYKLTKAEILEFSNWQALKARYSKLENLPLPPIFWLAIVLIIVDIILQLYLSGRFRF